MYSTPERFSRLRHLGTGMTLLGIVGGLVLIILGAVQFGEHSQLWLIVVGSGIIIASICALVLTRLALKIESNTSRLYNETRDLHDTVARYGQTLVMIADNTSISDTARSIAHRSQERDALRGAILEEVRRADFEAAFYLIDDLERRLGYRVEAERLRRETMEARDEALRDKLDDVLRHISKLLGDRRWDQARQEIERVQKLMPADDRVSDLWNTMARRREQYKQELLGRWKDAARDKDLERGLGMLKELDQYLTREEARSLESTARELFKERLMQLGVKFQFAVKERRWQDALITGLEIIEEFPNARMAHEVQEHLDTLRERAGITTNIEVTARSGPPASGGEDPFAAE